MKDETEIAVYAAYINGEEYDESSKKLFRNKEIIAPILKYVVEEYKDYSVEEIIAFIDADTVTSNKPVSDIPPIYEKTAETVDRGTEFSSITEKIIRYDVHLKAKNPKLSNDTEHILVMIYVDFEVQNNYKPSNPSYPVIKRAIYYASRDISAQLGTITGTIDYSRLEKIYSIWVCNENIPKKLQNTMTRYTIQKKDIIGKTDEPESDYDLMNITIIRRGSDDAQEDIFQYLNAVFTSDLENIRRYVDIKKDSEVEKEVKHMSGMGQSIYERGIAQGVERGIEQGEMKKLINLVYRKMLKGKTSIEIAEDIEEEESVVEQIKEAIFAYRRDYGEKAFDAGEALKYLKMN